MEKNARFRDTFVRIIPLLVLALVITTGILGYHFLSKTTYTSQHMIDDELPILFEIHKMETAIHKINSSAFEMISFPEDRESEEKDLEEGLNEFDLAFKSYKTQVESHYQYKTQELISLERKYTNFKNSINKISEKKNSSTYHEAETNEEEILRHLDDLKNNWRAHTEATRSRQVRNSDRYKLTLLIFTAFGALLILLLAYFIRVSNEKWQSSQLRLMDNSRLASLGEMAGGIAHEINNPLTIIKMRVVSLRKKFKKDQMDEASFTSAMDNIEETVERISKIIKGLKNLVHGKVDDIDVVKIKEVFETVQSVCDDSMRSKGIQFKVNYDEDSFNQLVRCSTVQLSQVILNLLKNSIDAIEEHQSIDENRWISIDTAFRNNRIYFYFNDSGPGIPDKHKQKIFDPFFTTKPVGKGTGLGMPICKSIVEQHGGALLLAEDRTKDGNFVMELPIVTAEELFSDDEPMIQ